ncbi:MAG: DUF4465 domain-containing protein [Bacteroidota bacterium]|nr:DUF4465 domain-containing protein [Bacteroidota bacterium]
MPPFFGYSNTTDVTTVGYGNQYSAVTGQGYQGSSNYAVCYPSPSAEVGLNTSAKVSGFYVTNSTYAYLSMKNGDAFSKKFGGETGNDPDYFKLMIEALNTDGNPVDTVYFYLADFRFTDHSKDYILNKNRCNNFRIFQPVQRHYRTRCWGKSGLCCRLSCAGFYHYF